MDKTAFAFTGLNEINIMPIGDLHLGSDSCAIYQFKEAVRKVNTRKGYYTILMGDLFDAILPEDKRFAAQEGFKKFEHYYQMVADILRPVFKQGKVIAILEGNHEYKAFTKKGYGSPCERLADEFGAKYLGYSGFIRLSAHSPTSRLVMDKFIFVHHGFFSGRMRGGKVNALEQMSMNFDADVYICGHSHDSFNTERCIVNYYGAKDRIFVNSGTFNKTAEWGTTSYSEQKAWTVQKIGCPTITWKPFVDSRTETGRIKGEISVH